jgi:hypothetical protein
MTTTPPHQPLPPENSPDALFDQLIRVSEEVLAMSAQAFDEPQKAMRVNQLMMMREQLLGLASRIPFPQLDPAMMAVLQEKMIRLNELELAIGEQFSRNWEAVEAQMRTLNAQKKALNQYKLSSDDGQPSTQSQDA